MLQSHTWSHTRLHNQDASWWPHQLDAISCHRWCKCYVNTSRILAIKHEIFWILNKNYNKSKKFDMIRFLVIIRAFKMWRVTMKQNCAVWSAPIFYMLQFFFWVGGGWTHVESQIQYSRTVVSAGDQFQAPLWILKNMEVLNAVQCMVSVSL